MQLGGYLRDLLEITFLLRQLFEDGDLVELVDTVGREVGECLQVGQALDLVFRYEVAAAGEMVFVADRTDGEDAWEVG